jgi:hypothetical protein
MPRNKGKEKCKDEPEESGPAQSGDTPPAESRSKSRSVRKGGQKLSQSGRKTRDNPPEDFSPRTYKSGNPRVKGAGKNGPARGGDKAVAYAARESVAQADGLKDALREQAEETRVAQDANMHLRRDLTSVKDDLKQAEERLGGRRNAVDKIHDERRKNFHCHWQDGTAEATLTFWLFVLVFPAIFVLLAIYLEQFESLMCWQWMAASMLYQVAAVFADRRLCALRGYRSKFCERTTHSYSSMTNQDWDDVDRRADAMSLRELKHVDARYSVLAYRKTLNGVLLNEDTFGKRTGAPDYFLISHELLAQLTTPNVMLTDDFLVLRDRLLASVKTTHTVNLDKDLYQEGEDVAGNTLEVAQGLWYQNRQARTRCF